MRAWRWSDRFDPERGSPRPWLYQIMRNVVHDALAARNKRPMLQPTIDALRLVDQRHLAQPDRWEPARQRQALRRLLTQVAAERASARPRPAARWRAALAALATTSVAVVLAILVINLGPPTVATTDTIAHDGNNGVSAVAHLSPAPGGTTIELTGHGLPPNHQFGAWLQDAHGNRVLAGGHLFESSANGTVDVRLLAQLERNSAVAIGITGTDKHDVATAPLPTR